MKNEFKEKYNSHVVVLKTNTLLLREQKSEISNILIDIIGT